jgi:hypothetical protein
MNRPHTLSVLILFTIFINVRPVRADAIVCDNFGCVDLNTFSANISSALTNNAVGYVSIVGTLTTTGGLARTGADGNVPMSEDLPVSVASVSKTLTTIGVLQALSALNLTIDDYISPFLNPKWGTPGPNVNLVTFRQLLTHTSGFRNCNDPGSPPPDADPRRGTTPGSRR